MKRIFVWFVAASLLLTAGCSKKAEDITSEAVWETQTEQAVQTAEKDDFAQFRDEAAWKEDLKGTCHGQDSNISIYTDIILPEFTQTSVVAEGKVMPFDEKHKESVLKGVFGDEDIYYHDKAHWTMEELEKEIEGIQEGVEEVQEDEDFISEQKKDLEELRTYLASADREYTRATDFAVNEYIAKKNGKWCEMSFFIREDGSRLINFNILPDDGSESETLTGSNRSSEETLVLSQEDAEKAIMDFAGDMGIDIVCREIEDRTQAADSADSESDTEVHDYYINLGMGINGESVVGTKRGGGFFGFASVSDEGVYYVMIEDPVELTRVSEHVPLLSLDKIKEAFREELKEHMDDYFDRTCTRFRFDSLELGYIWQLKDASTGEGASVPVWILKGHTSGIQIYVNAIDGTVLDKDNLQ